MAPCVDIERYLNDENIPLSEKKHRQKKYCIPATSVVAGTSHPTGDKDSKEARLTEAWLNMVPGAVEVADQQGGVCPDGTHRVWSAEEIERLEHAIE